MCVSDMSERGSHRQLVWFSAVPQRPYALRAMERFVRAAVGGQSSSSRAAEPGVDSGPRGGGGGQCRTSRAAEPGEDPCET